MEIKEDGSIHYSIPKIKNPYRPLEHYNIGDVLISKKDYEKEGTMDSDGICHKTIKDLRWIVLENGVFNVQTDTKIQASELKEPYRKLHTVLNF